MLWEVLPEAVIVFLAAFLTPASGRILSHAVLIFGLRGRGAPQPSTQRFPSEKMPRNSSVTGSWRPRRCNASCALYSCTALLMGGIVLRFSQSHSLHITHNLNTDFYSILGLHSMIRSMHNRHSVRRQSERVRSAALPQSHHAPVAVGRVDAFNARVVRVKADLRRRT